MVGAIAEVAEEQGWGIDADGLRDPRRLEAWLRAGPRPAKLSAGSPAYELEVLDFSWHKYQPLAHGQRIAQGKGRARILLEESSGSKKAALTLLTLGPGAAVPEHTHDASDEILYLEQGSVEMTIAGQAVKARAGDAIHIPAGTPHSARVVGKKSLKAVQVYVGPGPEQRFKATMGTR